MHKVLVVLLLIMLAGCSTATPPPVQGPAVQGDGVVIDHWQYFGPEAVKKSPSEGANVRVFEASGYKAWVIWTKDGFDRVWEGGVCTTQPVAVVHVGSVELWTGPNVPPPNTACGAMRVYHKFTVAMKTNIPPEQWRSTLHPPPR